MSSKIYTKTGDKGVTSLLGGTKVPKSDLRIESYGTIDELNSFIGLLCDHLPQPIFDTTREQLRAIQDRLFTIGSCLACDPEKEPKFSIPDLLPEDIHRLEKAIDEMDAGLPPLKSFVLPGGHVAVSTAHVTRCVCRRAERCCVRLQQAQADIDPLILAYLNRLSDYLFMAARYVAHRLHAPEIPWNPRK